MAKDKTEQLYLANFPQHYLTSTAASACKRADHQPRYADIPYLTLSNALRLESYVQDAEREGDQELAEFFRRAQADNQKGGEQGKDLLRARLSD